MALIVVKENQTVRGVRMLSNIFKLLFLIFVLLFSWGVAFGETTEEKEVSTEETEEEPDCE